MKSQLSPCTQQMSSGVNLLTLLIELSEASLLEIWLIAKWIAPFTCMAMSQLIAAVDLNDFFFFQLSQKF